MKFFVVFFLVAACIAQCLCASIQEQLTENQQGVNENLESLRIRKSAKSAYGAPAPSYGGASYAPPPCPTNYLFSCGPQLQPVPCAQGYQGAYSENVPQYVAPQYIAPRQYAFPQYAVPVITEV